MTIFLTSFESIASIILLILLGYFLKQKGWFHDSFAGDISKLIMNIALPASIFVSVLKYLTLDSLLSLSSGLLFTFSAVGVSYLIAWALVKILRISAGRRGVFINTVANANTIFIGLPLNIALFGDKSLPYFLVYYITNTVSTWAIGAIIIANDSQHPTEKKASFNWKKLLPAPLIGFLIALVFLVFSIPVPSFVTSTLTYAGNIVTPLSLIYIGIVLANAGLSSIHFDRDTIVALLGRFVLSPILMFLALYAGMNVIGSLPTIEQQTFMIQSAVPALAVLPILANEADGDVQYATNIVTTSTLLFIIVIPIVMLFIS